MIPESTRAERKAQRDLVLRSSLLADTPEERHGVYLKRKPRPVPVVPVVARVFVSPRVVEVERSRDQLL